MFPLPITTWIYLGVAAVIVVEGGVIMYERSRLETVHAQLDLKTQQFQAFQDNVALLGTQARKEKEQHEATDKLNKETTDATIKKLTSTTASLGLQLSASRASVSTLPSPSPTAPDSFRATVSRKGVNGAVQRLDESVQGLIEQGDKARVELDGVKQWGKGVK